jgi:hypothetical protein
VDQLFCAQHAAEGIFGRRRKWFVQQSVDKRGRCTDHGLRDERAIAIAQQHAKLGLTGTIGESRRFDTMIPDTR